MSTLNAYNVLTKMGQLESIPNGARLTIRTAERLSHEDSERKADDIESLMKEYGVNLICNGGTNYGTSISFDLYPSQTADI